MEKLSLERRIRAEYASFSGHLSVYADDLRGGTLEVDADRPFESASCIKLFIMAEFFRQVREGLIQRDELLVYEPRHAVGGSGVLKALDVGVQLTAKNFLTLMLIVSDNIATNVLIERLGLGAINDTCKALGLEHTVLHNPIDFDTYSRLGTTTPREYGRVLAGIQRGALWNPELSKEMLEVLKNQHYNRMLVHAFPQELLNSEDTGESDGIYVASKSGSMDACRNDGGIVHTPLGDYVVCIFTTGFSDPFYHADHEAYRYGGRVSRLLLDHFLSSGGHFGA